MLGPMPKLWAETIADHRGAVRNAALDATGELVLKGGLTAVTMSQVAEEAGIGRATLYKYFPDAEALLTAWHERQISEHLSQLADARERAGAGQPLEAVLTTYAFMTHHRSGGEFAVQLHRGGHVTEAQEKLKRFIQNVLNEARNAGHVRTDVPTDELATYCIQSLTAAGALQSGAAVNRLIAVTLDGLRPR